MHLTEEQKADFMKLLADYGLVKKQQTVMELNGKEADAQAEWQKGKDQETKLACMLEDLDIVGEEEKRLFDELDQTKAQLKKTEAMHFSQEDYMQMYHCVSAEMERWEKLKAGFIKDQDKEFEAKCAAHVAENKALLVKLQEMERCSYWNKAR